MTGDGMDEFFQAVEEARVEYETCVPLSLPRRPHAQAADSSPPPLDPPSPSSDYRPELEKMAKAREDKKTAYAQEQLDRLMKDMAVAPASGAANPNLSSARAPPPAARRKGNAPGDDDDGIISRGRWREDDAPWGEDEDGDGDDGPQRDNQVMWGDDDDDVEIDRSEEPIGGMFGRGGGGGGENTQMSNWPRPA